MQDYAQLEALLAVEREGSIDAAARAMGMTSSAVSQRIKSLEERIGAVVLKRISPVEPNEFGAALCRHTEAVGMMEENLIKSFAFQFSKMKKTNQIIKILVNDDSLSSWFMDVLHAQAKGNDQFLFEISIQDQDHSFEQMRQGLANVAISNTKLAVQGFKSRYLGSHVYRATASPAFVKRHFPDGITEECLKTAPSLRYSPMDDLQHQWIAKHIKAEVPLICHTIPSSHGFVSACLRDIGWGMNPANMVDAYIKSGELVELIPDAPLLKPLYWHCSRHVSEAIKDITDNVLTAANDHLCQNDPPAHVMCNRT
ncbi:LysR family transcriptional regulator ArgP [Ahrensia sp. 13_GOM-1096m]|uniref:LysR family transcriptional regulator ArgP n=1 Tax=Ahrensia sp. 13_GOM-1096m TaxID=1380380 RepID=UPI000685815A|nr:LysR family transcriptional regulator ArgP [Ahrensia sp. 13_GOM-1096m]